MIKKLSRRQVAGVAVGTLFDGDCTRLSKSMACLESKSGRTEFNQEGIQGGHPTRAAGTAISETISLSVATRAPGWLGAESARQSLIPESKPLARARRGRPAKASSWTFKTRIRGDIDDGIHPGQHREQTLLQHPAARIHHDAPGVFRPNLLAFQKDNRFARHSTIPHHSLDRGPPTFTRRITMPPILRQFDTGHPRPIEVSADIPR